MTMENNDRLKQRLVGAAVLISLIVVFLPMLVERGPAPTADRPAVPPKTQWRIEGWKGDNYQPPALPEKAARQTVEVTPLDVTPREPTAMPTDKSASQQVGQQAGQQADAGPGSDSSQRAGGQAASQSLSVAKKPAKPAADVKETTVKKGDTLYGIFRRLGIPGNQVREVLKVPGAADKLKRLRPGQVIGFRVDSQGRIRAMEYRYSGGPPLRLKRIGGRLQPIEGGVGRAAAEARKAPKPAVAKAEKPKPQPTRAARPNKQQGPIAWVVQVDFYPDWDSARVLQAKLRGKGYPAFLKTETRQGTKGWLLQVGPEVKKSGAVKLAQQVQQLAGTKTSVVSYP